MSEADKSRDREAPDRAGGRAVLSFSVRIVKVGATLVAPLLDRLPAAEAAAPLDDAAEQARFDPLRVLEPRFASAARRTAGLLGRFGLVLLLTASVMLLPTPAGLSDSGHRAMAALVLTGSLLALEPVSLPIAALMVPLALIAFGLADASLALQTFSSPVVFLILGSLFLAEGLRKHGLTRRLALATIQATGGRVSSIVLGLMGIAAFLSMWVENTATAAVLLPVALTISNQIPDPKKARPVLVILALGIAYGASLGGMVTIMGSSSNAVASSFLSEIRPWAFIDWMRYGLPGFLLVFPVTFLLLGRLVRVEVDRLDIGPVRDRVAKMGPIGLTEWELIAVLLGAAILWVGGSSIESALGLPPSLLSAAVVALIAVAYIGIRGIIDWEDMKGVSWGIFLIIGAGLALGQALSRSGATDWIATLIAPVIGMPLMLRLLLIVTLAALATNLLNNTTIAAVFVPVLITLTAGNPELNPIELVLPATMATTFGYSLPSASGRMALLAASGMVGRREMLTNGMIVTLVSAVILATYFFVLTTLGLI